MDQGISTGHLIQYFSFASGMHYNLENFYRGFSESKDKQQAFRYLMPIIFVYVMLIGSSFS